MINTKNKIEILAPCGKLESVYAAVRNGCSAIYFGGKKFSARANAENFSNEEIIEAVNYCHFHNVKVYRAINTVLFDYEIEEALSEVENSLKIGVDAFIVQDLGFAKLLFENFPNIKLNASTQMTIHTADGAKMAKELGFSRVVLSRELSLEEISNIAKKTDVELEVFAHGALCYSVSGQCLMSAFIGSRSANRGACAGSCRLPFSILGEANRYDLSLKDLSYYKHIKELEEIGVASLKIEGRMKRPEYTAAATSACRNAVNGEDYDEYMLKSIFSRSGFTDGYFNADYSKDMFGVRVKEDVISAKNYFPELRESYKDEVKSSEISFHIEILSGEKTSVTAKSGKIYVQVFGEVPEIANNRPTDFEMVEKQFSKLGGTRFNLGEITADIDDGLIVPASKLNELRRKSIEEIDRIFLSECDKSAEIPAHKKYFTGKIPPRKINEFYFSIETLEQLRALKDEKISSKIFVPIEIFIKNPDEFSSLEEKIVLKLPRFVSDEIKLSNDLSTAKNWGAKSIKANNLGEFLLAKTLGYEIFGGEFLNVTNSSAVKNYAELGAGNVTVSLEMKTGEIANLSAEIPLSAVVYGKIPLMLGRVCPIKYRVGCGECKGEIHDRTHRTFKILCHKDYVEILNSETLVMLDRLDELSVDVGILNFTNENRSEVLSVIKALEDRKNPLEKFTRGLYYRGV